MSYCFLMYLVTIEVLAFCQLRRKYLAKISIRECQNISEVLSSIFEMDTCPVVHPKNLYWVPIIQMNFECIFSHYITHTGRNT